MSRLGYGVFSLALMACGSSGLAPRDASQGDAPQGTTASASPSASARVRPPEVPSHVQRFGVLKKQQRAALELTVMGREVTPEGTYLKLGRVGVGEPIYPGDMMPCGNPYPGHGSVQIVPGSGSEGVARGADRGGGATRRPVSSPVSALLVRLAGAEPLAESMVFTVRGCPVESSGYDYEQERGFEQKVTVSGAARSPLSSGIAEEFLRRQAEWFQAFGRASGASPFAAFAAGRLLQYADQLRSAAAPGKIPAPVSDSHRPNLRNSSRTEAAELMDFYTGSSQVIEAMSSERGLGESQDTRFTLPISELEGVEVEERDYAALTAALPGKPQPKLDPLSRYLPADAIVVEFGSLPEMVATAREFDQRLALLLQTAEGQPGPQFLDQRYREQLALELDGLAEKLGNVVVGSVACVLSDPYLREGSDVSLVFETRSRALFSAVLAEHAKRAKERNASLALTEEDVLGQKVQIWSTPDGSIRRYQLELPGLTFVSNSRGAMAHLIAVHNGSAASLSAAPDYRYARAQVPWQPNTESAFLFLGDALMVSLTNPRSKILEARRVTARVELSAVDSAALLYGWMQGKPPGSLRELQQSPWFQKGDLKHFDGAPITWSPESGASSRWGTAQRMVPIIDLDIERISETERESYGRFREGYEQGWRMGVDPTLVRLVRRDGGKRWNTDIRVLPVNRMSRSMREYQEVTEAVGGGHVVPGAAASGLGFVLAVGEDSPLREVADSHLRLFGGRRKLGIDFVGDYVAAGLADRAALWDILFAEEGRDFQLPAEGEERKRHRHIEEFLPAVPAWAAVHVRSKLKLAALLTGIRAMAEQSAPNLLKWRSAEPYRGVPITQVTARDGDMEGTISYAIAKDVLVVALQHDVLTERIDAVLDSASPQKVAAGAGAQFVTTLRPEAKGVMAHLASLLLDRVALGGHRAAARGFELLERGLGGAPRDPAAYRRAALRLLGYVPTSPQGGSFTFTPEGLVSHPVYGTALEPAIPDARSDTGLHRAIRRILEVEQRMGVEPRGREQELQVRGQLTFGE